jgi:hypothetical protein
MGFFRGVTPHRVRNQANRSRYGEPEGAAVEIAGSGAHANRNPLGQTGCATGSRSQAC